MKKFISVTVMAVLVIISMPNAMAQFDAKEAFVSAPPSIFPLLDEMTKMDMVDYFESSMSTPSTNAMEGKSRITAMSPQKMTVEMTNSSSYEIDLLPTSSGETVIGLIATVATPAHDSQLTIYSQDWSKPLTEQMFSRPTLDDWLTPEGKANKGMVEGLVPFLLIAYSYDPATSVLTLTNNTKEFLSDDIYEIVAPFIQSTLSYKWNGKKFSAEK